MLLRKIHASPAIVTGTYRGPVRGGRVLAV
jgi:hypothetical protein